MCSLRVGVGGGRPSPSLLCPPFLSAGSLALGVKLTRPCGGKPTAHSLLEPPPELQQVIQVLAPFPGHLGHRDDDLCWVRQPGSSHLPPSDTQERFSSGEPTPGTAGQGRNGYSSVYIHIFILSMHMSSCFSGFTVNVTTVPGDVHTGIHQGRHLCHH